MFFFSFCYLGKWHWAQCSLGGSGVFFRVLLARTASLGSVFARWVGVFFAFCLLGKWHWAQCSLGGSGVFFSRFVSKNSVIGVSVR